MKYTIINRTCISLIWLMSLCGASGCKKEITTLLQPAEPGAPPVITGFTPDVSWYNHHVEISGNNFSSELANNTVTIGNVKAEILEASTTKLKVRLATETTGGYIHVRTNGQETISNRELKIRQLVWQKAIGGSDDDIAMAIYPLAGGGYYVAGSANSKDGDITTGNKGKADMWFAKLDSSQHIVWQKSMGGSGDDQIIAAAPAADGGLIVAGNAGSTDGDFMGGMGGAGDIWVIKTDGNGTLQYKKLLGGSGGDFVLAMITAADGSCVIAGYTTSKDGDVTDQHGGGDMWVVKLDGTGKVVWKKALGGIGDDLARAIAWDTDGGILVAGATNGKDANVPSVKGDYDIWVVKLNASGVLVWQKTMGGTNRDNAVSITATPDGGSALVGYTSSSDGDVTNLHGGTDMWVVKLNVAGGIRWQKTLGGSGNEVPASIMATADGGLVIGGNTTSKDGDVTGNHGGQDMWIVQLNADKKITGQAVLGGSNLDELRGMAATTDGAYVLAGWTSNTDGDVTDVHGKNDMWLLKVWE